MKKIYQNPETEGILLVDAENAFNRLNRSAALHNIKCLCPQFSTVLSNTYSDPVRMVIPGSGEICSSEGTTQGDPLAMAMYALAVTPLIGKLYHLVPTCKQVWYADDSTAAGSIGDLRKWWDEIFILGPGYGYFPNGIKTHLIVKAEYAEQAHSLFSGTGIEVTTRGHRHLGAVVGSAAFREEYVRKRVDEWVNGAVVGSAAFREEYVRKRVDEWVNEIRCLSKISQTQPHAAYSAFVHGLTGHWSHVMRTIPDISHLLTPPRECHPSRIYTLTLWQTRQLLERKIFALPARLEGLGLMNPATCSDCTYQFSIKLTTPMVDLIVSHLVR